jgi:hypothetical protein
VQSALLGFDEARELSSPRTVPTRPDRLLTRAGLDKLPQLFNVMTSQMNLVGPRPHLRSEPPRDALLLNTLQSVNLGLVGSWVLSGDLGPSVQTQGEFHYIRIGTPEKYSQAQVDWPRRSRRGRRSAREDQEENNATGSLP